MQKRDRGPIWFGIITVVLTVIGIAGVPDDLGTWQRWIEGALHVMNYESIRVAIFFCAIITFLLIFYRPDIRKQIGASFKLGSPVAIAYFAPPILDHGWKLKDGKPLTCSMADVPGVG